MRYRRAWLYLGCGVGAILVVLLVAAIFIWPAITQPESTPRQPVVEQPLNKTTLQQVQDHFGPWQLASPDSTGAPAIVLLGQDGGTYVSSWRMDVDSSWKEADPVAITRVTAGDQDVQLQTNDGRTYTVGYEQPFVLEREPEHVFAFRSTGENYQIVTLSIIRAFDLARSL